MYHPLAPSGKLARRYRLAGLLLASLLACGVLFTLGGPVYASAAPVQNASPSTTNPGVTYANGHWNWTYYDHTAHDACNKGSYTDCTSKQNATSGQFQPSFQCAEFVARAMAAEGIIYPLKSTSSQSDFQNYKPGNGKTYDLLLISPVTGLHTLADFLLTWGYVTNIGTKLSKATPGDMVVFDDSGSPTHTGVVIKVGSTTATTILDLHNTARYQVSLKSEAAGFTSWYILHVTPAGEP